MVERHLPRRIERLAKLSIALLPLLVERALSLRCFLGPAFFTQRRDLAKSLRGDGGKAELTCGERLVPQRAGMFRVVVERQLRKLERVVGVALRQRNRGEICRHIGVALQLLQQRPGARGIHH